MCFTITDVNNIVVSALLTAFLCFTVSGQTKKPEALQESRPLSQSRQIFLVVSNDWNDTAASGRLFERKSAKTTWKQVLGPIPVVLGRNGLSPANSSISTAVQIKYEGDGKSPAGAFPLTQVFGKAKKPFGRLEYISIDEFTECVDDQESSHYNRIVNRLKVGNFDWVSSEKMAEVTPEYDLGVFVAYNTYPVVKGRGSCIFLHIWKDAGTPTAGCTAMSREDLENLIKNLDPEKNPYLVQLPLTEYQRFQQKWTLPKIK